MDGVDDRERSARLLAGYQRPSGPARRRDHPGQQQGVALELPGLPLREAIEAQLPPSDIRNVLLGWLPAPAVTPSP